eukprot:6207723-Heterocapsa_arctica.AAC.1
MRSRSTSSKGLKGGAKRARLGGLAREHISFGLEVASLRPSTKTPVLGMAPNAGTRRTSGG